MKNTYKFAERLTQEIEKLEKENQIFFDEDFTTPFVEEYYMTFMPENGIYTEVVITATLFNLDVKFYFSKEYQDENGQFETEVAEGAKIRYPFYMLEEDDIQGIICNIYNEKRHASERFE